MGNWRRINEATFANLKEYAETHNALMTKDEYGLPISMYYSLKGCNTFDGYQKLLKRYDNMEAYENRKKASRGEHYNVPHENKIKFDGKINSNISATDEQSEPEAESGNWVAKRKWKQPRGKYASDMTEEDFEKVIEILGTSGGTMEEVAKAVGLNNSSTIYNYMAHNPDKKEIYERVRYENRAQLQASAVKSRKKKSRQKYEKMYGKGTPMTPGIKSLFTAAERAGMTLEEYME